MRMVVWYISARHTRLHLSNEQVEGCNRRQWVGEGFARNKLQERVCLGRQCIRENVPLNQGLRYGREVEKRFQPVDITHALLNQYSIRKNDDGTIEVYDDWDFPVIDKAQIGQESPIIRIVGSPDTIRTGNVEGMIYPNSIYTGHSRYYYSSQPIPVGRNGYDKDGNVSLANSAIDHTKQKVKELLKLD